MTTTKRMRAHGAIGACVVAALALAGCGAIKNTYTPNPGSSTQLTVVLQGQPDASDIGIYEAQALGYLKQTDMDVKIVPPSGGTDASALQEVYNGRATIGLTDQPGILFARDNSDAIVAVGAAVQHPLDGIVSLKSAGIDNVDALKGKRVALTGSAGTRSLFGQMLTDAGVPASKVKTTVVQPSQVVPDLLSGKVAASFGSDVYTTTAALAQHHKQVNTIAPSAAGVPDYNGLVIAVQKGEIVDHAPIPRRFVQAVARGYKAVRANPQQAVANMIAQVPSLAPQKKQLLAAVEAMLPDFFPTGNHPWGWMTVTQWNKFGTWLRHSNLITNPEAPVDASTNELLAGQGV